MTAILTLIKLDYIMAYVIDLIQNGNIVDSRKIILK